MTTDIVRKPQIGLSPDASPQEVRTAIQTWYQDGEKINNVSITRSELAKMLGLSFPAFIRELRSIKSGLGMLADEEGMMESFFDWVEDNKTLIKQKMESLTKQEALGMNTFYDIMDQRRKAKSEGKPPYRDPVDGVLLQESTKLIDNSNRSFAEVMKNFGNVLDAFVKLTRPEDKGRGGGDVNIMVGDVLDACDKADGSVAATKGTITVSRGGNEPKDFTPKR